MCCSNWSNRALKYQLLVLFSIISLCTIIICGLGFIGYVAGNGENVKTNIKDGFLANAENDAQHIVVSGTQLIEQRLKKLSSSFTNVMAVSAEDAFRTDYVYGYIPSRYNWMGQLISPTYNPNYDADVTYLHSTYNVYNKTLSDLKFLPNSINTIINRTASMDYTFIPSFQNNNEFLAGYFATDTILRYYPGAFNQMYQYRYINYQAKGDLWYEQTLANPHNLVYTSPYYDPIAKRLMITISRTLHNVYTNDLIGAFGSDLTLDEIQSDISNLKYLGSTTIMLEVSTGLVIAVSNMKLSKLITYDKIPNLKITQNLWINIIQNQDRLISFDNYYVLSHKLESSDGNYIIVTFIDKDQILNTFSTIIDKINFLVASILAIVGIVFCVILVIIVPLVFAIVYITTVPLQRLVENTSKITNNIGTGDLFKGVVLAENTRGIDEIEDIQNNFASIINNSKQKSNINPFYNSSLWTCEYPSQWSSNSARITIIATAPEFKEMNPHIRSV
uniref:HAMP domain-containing protein n=1 Tax=viral metagenome TaxID=1070528 RepID=A0A6C0E9K1_9ZZZZ